MAADILIIEDNKANLELMTYLLQAFGYVTQATASAVEGLEYLETHTPDLILCDVQMPGMDGYEFARRVKADQQLNGIPLIAVTALAMMDDRLKTKAAGFDGYLPKPIAPETFVRDVEAFLSPALRSGAVLPASAATTTSDVVRTTGPTVLVVDNRQINLDLATTILEHANFAVVTATGLHQALAVAHDMVPDLIVSDVCMDDGDGYTLIEAIKRDARLRNVPFIFLTSTVTNAAARERGLGLGASRFLFRPLEPEQLLAEVQSCLAEKATGADGNRSRR
jgi:two-component system cell cycle response regulator